MSVLGKTKTLHTSGMTPGYNPLDTTDCLCAGREHRGCLVVLVRAPFQGALAQGPGERSYFYGSKQTWDDPQEDRGKGREQYDYRRRDEQLACSEDGRKSIKLLSTSLFVEAL